MNPARGLKRLSRMVFRDLRPGWTGWGWGSWFRSTDGIDYRAKVGDGTGSSTVMAPVSWICKTFPEAPPALWRHTGEGQEEQVFDHPLLRLLRRPNEHYPGVILWWATMLDYSVDGNAYWLKVRNQTTAVQELWWTPNWLIEPKNEGGKFISHYEYKPGDQPIKLNVDDVVHFRNGLDPEDDRKGYSPLKSVLREVYTDDEAARYTAAMLKNMGVPGLIVSPEGDFQPSQDDVNATKEYLKTAFSGDKRGEPLVMSGPTRVAQFGFSPEQLLLKELRRVPEERVTAVLNIPAVVCGLGAGLDRSTFTNMAEARQQAYESGIIPTQRLISEDIWSQLLGEFESNPWVWRFGFDLSKVRVLQTDEDSYLRRMDVGIRGGWIQVGEGRRAVGLPVEDADKVYLRQVNLVEVPADGSEIRPMAGTAVPSVNGNGAGAAGHAQSVAEEVVRQMAAA